MVKRLGIKTLLSILIVGEIIVTYAGIILGMSTEEVGIAIASFAGIWILSILMSGNICSR